MALISLNDLYDKWKKVSDWVTGADAVSTPKITPSSIPLYNGSSYDSWRNNTQGTLLASAARTTGTTSPTQTNYNAKGVLVFLNVTAASGTGGLTVRAWGVDPVSGAAMAINPSPTAVIAVGITSYMIYPGFAGTTNLTQGISASLPRTWYVTVSHGDATSYTYSVGYALIL